ncbi:hypothetical protein ONZ43_g6781 [Nemania bipapillata]|uniref:Uncharacterized protein n=1 Tax=Nemania bipapillata TaxID=110536 RepID=A0ACC2HW16_9PEZI|nr:hypothetical protein ONZ43_g6781 [Nemania bipapillata]
MATNRLKRKSSRWQLLPDPTQTTDAGEPVMGRYSLLLFLRDLEAGTGRFDQFIQGLQNAPGVQDEKSTMAAVLAAALNVQVISQDYAATTGHNAKKRRVDLVGNEAAGEHLAEFDELVALARTVWSDPDDLRDILGDLYTLNLRPLEEGGRYPLSTIFDWARDWAEVRYRFANHALRDDIHQWAKYDDGPAHVKGNNANAAVHNSNVLLDAQLVEFTSRHSTGYSDTDRDIFWELYLLTPEEGRQLSQYSGVSTGLRIGLPEAFGYCVDFINAYMNWRIKVLESSRRQVMSTADWRNNKAKKKKHSLKEAHYLRFSNVIGPVDNDFSSFIEILKELLLQAEKQNAFNRSTFTALSDITQEIQSKEFETAYGYVSYLFSVI